MGETFFLIRWKLNKTKHNTTASIFKEYIVCEKCIGFLLTNCRFWNKNPHNINNKFAAIHGISTFSILMNDRRTPNDEN